MLGTDRTPGASSREGSLEGGRGRTHHLAWQLCAFHLACGAIVPEWHGKAYISPALAMCTARMHAHAPAPATPSPRSPTNCAAACGPIGTVLHWTALYRTALQVDKENRCCVCGSAGEYLRHSVVPHCYRQYFPAPMKSHLSHDIVLMCQACHKVGGGGKRYCIWRERRAELYCEAEVEPMAACVRARPCAARAGAARVIMGGAVTGFHIAGMCAVLWPADVPHTSAQSL